MNAEAHSPDTLMIRKLESNFPLSDEEKQALKGLPVQITHLKADQHIVRTGDRPHHCCLVLEGFTCLFKLSYEGRRQIMALHIPGDMPDLQSLHLEYMDSSIAAISPCTVGFIQHEDLRNICERYPRLTAAFWRETLVDASIFREWLLNIGRRDAYSRMAHLLCELLIRLEAVGLVKDSNTLLMPLTHEELADTIGITAVHVSRTMQALRTQGLVETKKSQITILDWARLQEAGEFDPLYLHLRDDS
ncbi:Crp/Fnr family transcriptional regulator [Billgrantia diversa]|uniref:Crp/Fnr family transcriptional regulator n=1 Tax=Halomonas sp. MCCC 1A13316 TaxID=2733487 RepID=UPI0018A520FF|nr:Crp/Fnr family transcriptional regulator [Halomonas sp. MCCC 1A13316]QOR40941.1 Crp/Fnr family transcriptional regulator [Halomonas sp. MCCC 1A13316]